MQLGSADKKLLSRNRYDWVHLAGFLRDLGVDTPEIKARLPEYGSLVLEDCGDQTLEDVIRSLKGPDQAEEISWYYEKAWDIISGFLRAPSSGHESWYKRAFDQEKLSGELRFFRENFLSKTLSYHLTPENLRRFHAETADLAHYLASRPRYLVHRDFHSRNLMWKNNRLVTIDFQDARPGPAAYDLVSLCFDPYVPLSPELRLSLFRQSLLYLEGRLSVDITREIRSTWKAMLIQRILKAIGSFGYLSTLQKRGDYLRYIPESLKILSLGRHEQWPFLSVELPGLIAAQLNKNQEAL